GNVTTYCFNNADQILFTVDGAGKKRGATYNPNSDVLTLTDALATPGVTTSTYDAATTPATNNLKQTQAPDTATGGPLSGRIVQYGYPTPSLPLTPAMYRPRTGTDS